MPAARAPSRRAASSASARLPGVQSDQRPPDAELGDLVRQPLQAAGAEQHAPGQRLVSELEHRKTSACAPAAVGPRRR